MHALVILIVALFGPAAALTTCGILFGRRAAIALWRYVVAWVYAAAILYTGTELAWWTFVIGVEKTDNGPAHFAHTVIAGLLIVSAGITWLAIRIQASELEREAPQATIR